MSETKFTEGPWWVFTKPKSENYALHINCGDMMELTVITVASDISCTDGRERTANANLIASAPEMYAMLEDLSMGREYYSKDAIDALLAKARGEK